MKFLGRGGGRRTKAAVVGTFAGTLLVFQAFAVIGALPAFAATGCTFAGSTVSVTMPADGDNVTMSQGAAGEILWDDPATVAPAAQCGAAFLVNTSTISITGGAGDQDVVIDLATGDWEDINWTVTLGADGVAGDTLGVTNAGNADAVDQTWGASGIDLNTDANLDVSQTGAEGFAATAGDGGDTISAAGDATTGAAFPDDITITGGAGADTLTGGDGNDAVDGGLEDDTVAGGLGDDSLTGSGGTDTVDYSAATASVNVNLTTGVATGQSLDTLASLENIIGSPQGDTLTGEGGDNVITPGAGDDTVDGAGDGVDGDTVDYSDATAAVVVDLDAGTATGGSGTDSLSAIENAQGSDFNDTLTGDAGDNDLLGGSGNDVLDGGDGADVLDGESGIDTADYSTRTDSVFVDLETPAVADDGETGEGDTAIVENVNFGSGDDTFTDLIGFSNRVQPGGGQNVLTGGGGGDTLDYSVGYDAGVTVNMAGGGTGADAVTGFENAVGTKFADFFTGDGSSNTIKGRGGNDAIRGGGGDDGLYGSKGNDTIRGGAGDDDMFGGKGKHDAAYGGTGVDLCRGFEFRRGCEIH